MAMTSQEYPIQLKVTRPERSSRGLALTGVLFPLKVLLLIPHLIVLSALNLAQFVVAYIGYFVVLFTGRYPEGLYGFVAGVMQWYARAQGWLLGLTDRYPPFSLDIATGGSLAVPTVAPAGPPPVPPPPPAP